MYNLKLEDNIIIHLPDRRPYQGQVNYIDNEGVELVILNSTGKFLKMYFLKYNISSIEKLDFASQNIKRWKEQNEVH